MLSKYYISIAAFLGALTVALGAFGAHALKAVLSPAALITYETAVRYQMYHVVALLFTGILLQKASSPKQQKLLIRAGLFFIDGIVLFSGSLYFIIAKPFLGIEGLPWVGVITPMGGLLWMVAWVLLGLSQLKGVENSDSI
ncbi:MAG: hypothetical protein RJA53_1452 [Bacteroidota bacterium]|jgi:uncharacterized membrane protein YgdD (TMEM256/DUF423 family)